MMKHSSIAVTGLVGPRRHGFPCAPAEGILAALAGAGIAPDGLAVDAGPRAPAIRAGAAQAPSGLVCAVPGLLWALEAAAAALPDVLFVVFYEAPWHAFDTLLEAAPDRFLAAPRTALDLWRRYYQEALRLRSVLGPRLLLVNAQCTGGWDPQLLGCLREHGVTLERSPPPAAPTEAERARAFGLAYLLDAVAPAYRDMYEALEGCATLLGRAPEFGQGPAAPVDGADAILLQWSHAHGERRARAELGGVRRDLHAADARLAQVGQSEAAARAALDATARRVRELEAEVRAGRECIERLQAELQEQWRSAQAHASEVARESAEARSDRPFMLEALHDTQEQLERSLEEADALRATAGRANEALRQAWLLVAAASDRPGAAG